MQEKIKKIWTAMDAETKKQTVKDIQKAFPEVNSDLGIRQNWFQKQAIPIGKQDRVFLLCKQNLKEQLQKQADKIKELKSLVK